MATAFAKGLIGGKKTGLLNVRAREPSLSSPEILKLYAKCHPLHGPVMV